MAAFALASLPGLMLPVVGRRVLAGAARHLPARIQSLAWFALAAWIAARPLLAHAHHH
jgi:hypothetical protein